MSQFITQEYRRLLRQSGALLKKARIHAGLTRTDVATKLNLEKTERIHNAERGRSRDIWLLPKLAQLYSRRINIYLDFPDDNQRLVFRQQQVKASEADFCNYLGAELKRLREHYNYTVEQLADLSHIPAEEINVYEDGETILSMERVCLLAAFFNRGIIPELIPLE